MKLSALSVPRISRPHFIVLLFVGLSFLAMALSARLALQSQVTGHVFIAGEQQLLLLEQGKSVPFPVVALGVTPERMVHVTATDRLEEPDVLESYSEYNRFLQRQSELASLYRQADTLWALDGEGDLHRYPLRESSLADLRAGFYIQLLAGFLCVLIPGVIWAFNRKAVETRIYFLMGLGIAIACWSSAVYTSRELAVDGELFRLLSLLNHLGATAFGGGLVGLFACYPCRLVSARTATWLTLTFIPVWLSDSLQLFTTTAAGFHLVLMLDVVVALGFAVAQWRATARKPGDRAVLKWLLLSVMGTTMIFTLMNIVPAALMATTLGAQSFTLAGFTLGVVMMALGLSRYRLFNLDRWWYQYWSWLLAGLAVLVLDVVLVSLLHFGTLAALGIAAAAVGWAYMPVRNWLWRRLRPSAESDLQALLPAMLEQMFKAAGADRIHPAWGHILQQAFAPLQMQETDQVARPVLKDNGQVLLVPSLPGFAGWRLDYAASGTRLFTPQDEKLAEMMYALVEQAWHALSARDEGMLAERDRIRRDLHDDLGARLVSVMHSSELEQSQQQARQAMADLKSILNALEQTPCRLDEALAIWQMEVQDRLGQSGFQLEWQQNLQSCPVVDARSRHNLGRVLRELISNAVRHSGGDAVTVNVQSAGNELSISIGDNGEQFREDVTDQGQGRRIVQSRIEELGGAVSWRQSENGGCLVILRMAL